MENEYAAPGASPAPAISPATPAKIPVNSAESPVLPSGGYSSCVNFKGENRPL